jgi:isoprenylcysteine carboxyl methyltransferase (ICMT) family protein YpbQ
MELMLNLLLTISLQSLIGSSMKDRRTFGRLIVCGTFDYGTFYSKFLTVVHYTLIFLVVLSDNF